MELSVRRKNWQNLLFKKSKLDLAVPTIVYFTRPVFRPRPTETIAQNKARGIIKKRYRSHPAPPRPSLPLDLEDVGVYLGQPLCIRKHHGRRACYFLLLLPSLFRCRRSPSCHPRFLAACVITAANRPTTRRRPPLPGYSRGWQRRWAMALLSPAQHGNGYLNRLHSATGRCRCQ